MLDIKALLSTIDAASSRQGYRGDIAARRIKLSLVGQHFWWVLPWDKISRRMLANASRKSIFATHFFRLVLILV